MSLAAMVRFSIPVAHSGSPRRLTWWGASVVIDLIGPFYREIRQEFVSMPCFACLGSAPITLDQ